MSATPEDAIEYMPVAQEMRQSFLEYSMSVIVSRALPDVRDGLKPVHRRILYTMHAEGLRPDRAYRKAATTVGGVMGTYHPHGDSAIYEALVRMAQPWAMRVQLIDGHGNFGSLGGEDPPAAMRYCNIGSTRVTFADNSAQIRLDSLAELFGAAPNSTTEIDLKLRDRNGDPVRATKFFHSGSHPTLTIRTREGYELGGSHNHPVLCLVDVLGVPTLLWKLLSEVRPGDRAVIFRGTPAEEGDLTDRERAIAVLTGGLIAEGFSQDHRWGFNNTDESFFEAILAAHDEVVGGARYTSNRILPSGKVIHELDIHATSHALASEVGELSGYYSAEKRIPEYVWSKSLAFKRAVLQAMFEGDGSCSLLDRNSLQVAYTTISEQLAKDVQQLLLQFGIISRQCYDDKRDCYRVYICNKREARLFSERIGFWGQKQQRLEGFLALVPTESSSMSHDFVPGLAAYIRANTLGQKGWKRREWLVKHNIDRIERWERYGEEIFARIDSAEVRSVVEPLVDGRFYYAEVVAVEDSGVQPVYSVKVESPDHSFLADGFVNHNTEARMSQATMSMLESIDEDTVEWRPNFDGTTREPQVLPSALPNLLVNGSTGIAVGMATNMAPHNLHEVIAGLRAMIAKPDIGIDELMTHIPGPDFPTGGLIVGMDGVKEAYQTGRGIFRIRAAARIEDVSARRKGIVVTELPYTIGPEKIIAKIKELINDKKLQGVADVKDLTDRKSGLRLVIECKTGFNPAALLEELYRLTPLQESFGVNNVALVNGHPRTLNLRELCHYYIEHRVEVVTRRTRFRLAKAEARAHILEGLVIALASIDEVVQIIRSSRDSAAAKTKLMKQFKLSEIQAEAILEMTLRRLTSLEVTKLKDELKTLKAYIAELKKLLGSEKLLRETVDTELQQVGEAFGSPRRTKLLDGIPQLASAASLEIPDDPTVVTLTSTGLVGRAEPGAFKGTRGRHDGVLATIATTARGQVGAITDTGRLLRAAVVEIPPLAGRNRGAPIREFFPELAANERVLTLVSTEDEKRAPGGLAFATAQGTVKRLAPDQYPTKSGQEVIGLKEGDVLVGVAELASDAFDLVLLTSDAQLLRTPAGAIRPQGRTAAGVAGMRVSEDAQVIAFGVIDPTGADDAVVVSMSDASAVKVTTAKEYPAKGRGGAGVRMQTFRKGEEKIVVAYIGPDPTAFSAGGDIVALPEGRLKRDAPGVKVEVEIASIARTRR